MRPWRCARRRSARSRCPRGPRGRCWGSSRWRASEPRDAEEGRRGGALLSAAGDDAAADAQLTAALPAIDALAAEEPDPGERKTLEEASARIRAALEEPRKDGEARLVPLGHKK